MMTMTHKYFLVINGDRWGTNGSFDVLAILLTDAVSCYLAVLETDWLY